jgi:hypothetical protein
VDRVGFAPICVGLSVLPLAGVFVLRGSIGETAEIRRRSQAG